MTLTTRRGGRPVGPGSGPGPDLRSREARLLPRYAALYPWLRPGEWFPAATLADRVLAGNVLRGSRAAVFCRVLVEEHFEFRGGDEAKEPRPRREDR
jgi:hypothetical protein